MVGSTPHYSFLCKVKWFNWSFVKVTALLKYEPLNCTISVLNIFQKEEVMLIVLLLKRKKV